MTESTEQKEHDSDQEDRAMSASALISSDGEKVTLRFSYNPQVIERLKDAVPSFARSWDPTAKSWTVHLPYIDQVLALLRELTPPVTVTRQPAERPRYEAPPPPPRDRRGRELNPWAHLHQAVPAEYRTKVLRALLQVLHPDKTGNDAKVAELVRQLTQEFRP